MAARSPLAAKVGARVREIRLARNVTQIELAKRMGVSSSEVSRAEIGSRMPTLPTLRRFADALRVSVGDLLDIEQHAIPAELSVLLADLRAAAPEVQAAALAQVNLHLDTLRAEAHERESRRERATAKGSGGGHVG